MRILVGMPEQGSRGGPAACEPPFIAELRRLGHEVEEEIYAFSDSSAGLAGRVSRVLRTRRKFQQRAVKGAFDLIHINTSFDPKALLRDSAILPALKTSGARIFLKFHGGDAELLKTTNPVLAVARNRVLANADGIGLLSSEEQRNFARAGIPEDKLFVIKNVVEENRAEPAPDFRQQLNLPGDMPLLLFIGRFIPAKGLIDVIRACGLLRDRDQQFYLLCIGDGPARREAEDAVAQLNLQNSIRFFGYIPEGETGKFYLNCDVLVFPTYHYEGFPMVIFNAAAAGLPIITTRIRAAADYLKEPQNCLWVEPKNPEMLADKISEILSNSRLSSSMRSNNKLLAAEFSAPTVTREYVAAYEQLMSR